MESGSVARPEMTLMRWVVTMALALGPWVGSWAADGASSGTQENRPAAGFSGVQSGFSSAPALGVVPGRQPQPATVNLASQLPGSLDSARTLAKIGQAMLSMVRGPEVRASGPCDSASSDFGLFSSVGVILFSLNGTHVQFIPSRILMDGVAPGDPTSEVMRERLGSKCEFLRPEHYALFGEAIALFEAIDDIVTACSMGSEKVCINRAFKFADVSGDGNLSVAEVSRVVRALAFFASMGFSEQGRGGLPVKMQDVYVGAAITALIGPTFAKNFIASVDFDDSGTVSLVELFQDRGPNSIVGSSGTFANVSMDMIIKGMASVMQSLSALMPLGSVLGGAFGR